MIDIKVISRKEAESLKANELPSETANISFYDPVSPRTPKDYHKVNYCGVCDNVFYVEIHDIDIEILQDYGLTYDTYFPEAAKLADFIENLSRSIIRLFVNVNTGKVEVRLVLRLSKNFTTSQVFKFLRITDTTQTN